MEEYVLEFYEIVSIMIKNAVWVATLHSKINVFCYVEWVPVASKAKCLIQILTEKINPFFEQAFHTHLHLKQRHK